VRGRELWRVGGVGLLTVSLWKSPLRSKGPNDDCAAAAVLVGRPLASLPVCVMVPNVTPEARSCPPKGPTPEECENRRCIGAGIWAPVVAC